MASAVVSPSVKPNLYVFKRDKKAAHAAVKLAFFSRHEISTSDTGKG